MVPWGDEFLPSNRLGTWQAILSTEAEPSAAGVYGEFPLLVGSIVFTLPSLTIPSTAATAGPEITLTNLPVEYFIDFDGWKDWSSGPWGDYEPPLFHLSASGSTFLRSLTLEGGQDPDDGLWRYKLASAQTVRFGASVAPLSDSPEPSSWSLLLAGLAALAVGAIRRHKR